MEPNGCETLVAWWRACQLDLSPFVHPEDGPVLDRLGSDLVDWRPTEFGGYIARPDLDQVDDARLRLGLLPVPYAGDLAAADIVVLLLNPGLSHGTFFAESEMPLFREHLVASLRQRWEGIDHPFPYLDPQFAWHDGFAWWERRLRGVLRMLATARFDRSYPAALRALSQRIALVQRLPYHSGVFRPVPSLQSLPSVQAAHRMVQEWLLPEARAGRKTLIVARQAAAWGLAPEDNVVVYAGGETRGASLGVNTSGGRAILARLGL